jgi:hypothetical protein
MAIVLLIFSLLIFSPTTFSQTKEMRKFELAFAEDEVRAEDYSKTLKSSVWDAYHQSAEQILQLEKYDEGTQESLKKTFSELQEKLEALEYRENETEALEEKVSAHLKILKDRLWIRTSSFYLDYLSWQRQARIESAAKGSDLVITNVGPCLGGTLGKRNKFYHLFADACLMYGHGNVADKVRDIVYRQSNVPYYGLKIAPGAGMIISSLGAEVGIKLPMTYVHQKLDSPDQTSFPGYKINEERPFTAMASLYSRWPMDRYFVQTEFAHVLGRDLTFWSLGAGYSF